MCKSHHTFRPFDFLAFETITSVYSLTLLDFLPCLIVNLWVKPVLCTKKTTLLLVSYIYLGNRSQKNCDSLCRNSQKCQSSMVLDVLLAFLNKVFITLSVCWHCEPHLHDSGGAHDGKGLLTLTTEHQQMPEAPQVAPLGGHGGAVAAWAPQPLWAITGKATCFCNLIPSVTAHTSWP